MAERTPLNEAEFFDVLHARVLRVWVTIALIGLCVLAFVVEAGVARSLWSIPSTVLVALGANFAPAVQSGEWWRLPASLFLHGNPMHLGFNMLALWQLGQITERLYGRLGFSFIYVSAGLVGCLASIWWKAGAVSVGASGAIFGACGALLAYVIVQRGAMPLTLLRQMRGSVLAFIGYSLFAGFAIPGIDNAAHIGGLLAGVILGAGLARPVYEPLSTMWRHYKAGAAIVICGVAAWALWHTAPQVAKVYHQHVVFEQVVHNFGLQELTLEQSLQTILAELRQQKISSRQAATQLTEGVIPAWDKQIDRLATETVAPDDALKRQTLVQYAILRRDAIRHVARGIETGERQWIESASALRVKADNLLLQLRLQATQGRH